MQRSLQWEPTVWCSAFVSGPGHERSLRSREQLRIPITPMSGVRFMRQGELVADQCRQATAFGRSFRCVYRGAATVAKCAGSIAVIDWCHAHISFDE